MLATVLSILLLVTPAADPFTAVHADQQAQIVVVSDAIVRWGGTSDPLDGQSVEAAVTEGLRRLDAVAILPCYQAWWGLARSTYEMLSVALLATRAGNQEVATVAWTASGYLVVMTNDAATKVDCSDAVM
jgi:hypothetical protein